MKKEQEINPYANDAWVATTNVAVMKEVHGVVTYLEIVEKDYTNLKELSTNEIGEITLTTRTKHVVASTYRVDAKQPKKLSDDLMALHGIDANSMIVDVLKNESRQAIHKNIYDQYHIAGTKNRVELHTKWQKFLIRLGIEIVDYVDINDKNSLSRFIFTRSNIIYRRSRRGPAQFVVVSGMLFDHIADDPAFIYSEEHNPLSLSSPSLVSLKGTFHGIQIFVNSSLPFKDTSVIIGRSTSQHDPGLFTGYHSQELFKVDNQDTFEPATTFNLSTRMAICMYGDTAYTQYWAGPVVLGKKPWWKKLLKA